MTKRLKNVNSSKRSRNMVLALFLLGSISTGLAHHGSPHDPGNHIMVTRNFTGIWDQVDHHSQGLALQVVEQLDGSRRSVVYWYTYGKDRKSAWIVGMGDLLDNRIAYELFESSDVGFMQEATDGHNSVTSIGTMEIEFESCNRGLVTFQTHHEEIGSGSFQIERLLEVMNTHCSGGISDDMHAVARFGEHRIALLPDVAGGTGRGYASFERFSGHMQFEVKLEGLPDGHYHLQVGQHYRGDISVHEGIGSVVFTSPLEPGRMMLLFDPQGMDVEIRDGSGVVLSSFGHRFEEDGYGHHDGGDGNQGNGHNYYDCGFGPGPGHGHGHGHGHGNMGRGMVDCVGEDEFLDIAIDLENTAILPDARGEAEWEMNLDRVQFTVEIDRIPVGFYPLRVGGAEVGIIEAREMYNGEVYGRIRFRDPEAYGRYNLDFEPRGNRIEVMWDGEVILKADFPEE
jgi:hypothetical protein